MRLDKLLFCEFARGEQSGDVTLLGFMPADEIAVTPAGPAGAAVRALPSLTCVAVLSHMQNVHHLRTVWEVRLNNEVIQRSAPLDIDRGNPSLRFHTLIMRFLPFSVPKEGDYWFKVIVEAGGETTSFSRRLRISLAGDSPTRAH